MKSPHSAALRLPQVAPGSLRPWVVGLIAVGVWWSWAGAAWAQSGSIITKTARGITVSVDTRGVDGAGYRPVEVTISTTAPTTADKTFTIEILASVGQYYRERNDLRVARDIELPAGSGAVQATLSVPQTDFTSVYAINVFADGRFQKNLSTTSGGSLLGNGMGNGYGDLPAPHVLVVGDTIPNTGQVTLALALQETEQYQYYSYSRPISTTSQTSDTPPNLPTLVVQSVAGLPQKWIHYSGFDVVCLSLEQLEEVKEKNEPAFAAVMRWARAGGNLWVCGVGDDWRRVGRIEELAEMGPIDDEAEGPFPPGWKSPAKDDFGRKVQVGLSELGADFYRSEPPYYAPYDTDIAPSEEPEPPPVEEDTPAVAHFVYREYELGLIVAFAADDPFPGTERQWRAVFNAMGPKRWLWHCRHGVSMVRENADYWDFLIPDVGMVPVTEFCVLISVFVLAIGPLNYWLLFRAKRLHLLIVTIPLGAAMVTLALFGYALVSDGLGTRVRVRSVSFLDQRNNEAVCWARLSYYSGLAPREGLTFPNDVAVLPFEFHPTPEYNDPPKRRELIWTEPADQQWLASGWLRSRTPMQLLTVRARSSRVGLDVIAPSDQDRRPKVKNRLNTTVLQLLVCADDGQFYSAEGVAPGETVVLGEFTSANREALLALHRANQPALPEGGSPDYYGGFFGLGYSYYYYGSDGSPPPSQEGGRLESVLNGKVRTIAGGAASLLAPRSYLAVVESSPEVVLGIDGAQEEASFHVILGRW